MFSIKNNFEYTETVRGSKFISLIFRIFDKNDANKYLNDVKIKYPNATHYCFAYVIDNDIKASDDGEPVKTAGNPILMQIQGNNLNYVLIIVVRYFGGTKLGTGLLTRTYSHLAKSVINPDNITELIEGYDITIKFNYENIKTIDYILGNSKIIDKIFDNDIVYRVLIKKELLNKLSNYNIEINSESYIEKE